MKQETILKLIEESDVIGFDYDNDDVYVTWKVTPGADKMLAWKSADFGNGAYEEEFFAVQYADLDEVDELYRKIVIDFVNFYYSDLRNHSSDQWNLFSDVASPRDEGLLQMLSFFGKTYDEFLHDVFFWFGISTEIEMSILESDIEDDDDWYETESLSAEDRLVIMVLDKLGKYELDIHNDEERTGYYWTFAKANDEIWASAVDYSFGKNGYYVGDTHYEHFKLSDEAAMSALRAVIVAEIEANGLNYEDACSTLELLGIDKDELTAI